MRKKSGGFKAGILYLRMLNNMPTNVNSPKESCPNKSNKKEEKQEDQLHWINFLIKDKAGNPMPNITIQLSLPDNSIGEYTSDENGKIEIKNIESSGDCTIKSDWKEVKIKDTVLLQ